MPSTSVLRHRTRKSALPSAQDDELEEVLDRFSLVGDLEGTPAGGMDGEAKRKAQRMGDRRVEVGDVDGVFDDLFSLGIGFAVSAAAPNAAARQQARKGFRVPGLSLRAPSWAG